MHESSGLGVDEPLKGGALTATRCLWLGAEAWRERVPPSGQGGRKAWVEKGLAGISGCTCKWKDFVGRGGAKAICATKKAPFSSLASALSTLGHIVATPVLGTTVKKELGVNPHPVLHKRLLGVSLGSLALLRGLYFAFVRRWLVVVLTLVK